ncbi:MAG: urease accessory protein UreD [Phormidesmis sp.]
MVDVVRSPHPPAPSPQGEGEFVLVQQEPHLSLRVACAKGTSTSFVAHQYATYPFRLSGNLRLDPTDPNRVYAYIMNASPGVLAGDDLRMAVEVGDRASLYLTDQSATKVHSKPVDGAAARVEWDIRVGADAYFEFMPEPIILFPSAALTHKMNVTLHPQGRMLLSEIVVPGRMARGELYAFEHFQSCLRIENPESKLCFVDNLRLLGQANRLKDNRFFTGFPILANFIVVVPGVALEQLVTLLQQYEINESVMQVCESSLPGCHGLLVRAIATQTNVLKDYQRHLLSCVRQLTRHSPIPLIPK